MAVDHKTRMLLVLKSLENPKTIDEVADDLGTTYMTVYRTVEQLRFAGKIVELPFGKGRRKVYQIATEKGELGEVRVKSPGDKWITITELFEGVTQENSNINHAGKLISGALAHPYIRSKYIHEGKPGANPGPLEVKKAIFELTQWLAKLNATLEVILLYSELWKDDGQAFSLMGQPHFNESDILDLAVAWEHLWQSWQD